MDGSKLRAIENSEGVSESFWMLKGIYKSGQTSEGINEVNPKKIKQSNGKLERQQEY
jgi:hypothetical protein